MKRFFGDMWRYHFTQIWFLVLILYLVVSPSADRNTVILFMCVGTVGAVELIGDCLRQLTRLQKRLQVLEEKLP